MFLKPKKEFPLKHIQFIGLNLAPKGKELKSIEIKWPLLSIHDALENQSIIFLFYIISMDGFIFL